MTINWKPGKTEAIVILRGKKAKTEKLKLQQGSARTFRVDRKMRRLNWKAPRAPIGVNVVQEYKHLGCFIDASSRLIPEAHNRERSALNAFVPLAKNVLTSKMLGI